MHLGERAGGVGQVSSMLGDVLDETWPDACETISVGRGGGPLTRAQKIACALKISSRQALGRAQWLLFGHLGLARIQRIVPRRVRAPYAVFLHGIEAWAPLPAADLSVLHGAALLLCNSDFTAAQARAANPELGEIVTCPLALRSMPSGRPSDRPRRPIALAVGRMDAGERYKGHTELIDAWPHVRRAAPDAELVIVGDGDDRARLEARAAASGAAGHITFTGFLSRDALDALYGEASLFVLPSRGEGFGLVYLEAMAHGLPCIGSRQDAAGEVIVENETGLLVDPGDGEALARAVVRTLTDRPFRLACGEAGYRRVLTHFTYDRFKQQILAAIDRHLERPPAGRHVPEAAA